MQATRSLRIFAVVGGILSLIVLALCVFVCSINSKVENSDLESARESLLKRMPPSDLRANYAILTSQNEILYPAAYAKRNETLDQALRAYPGSARIQLRVGVYGHGDASVRALRTAAALDTQNALPLYILASKAADRGALDEALALIKQGNLRKYTTGYPIRETDLSAGGATETMSVVAEYTFIGLSYCENLRQMGRRLSIHAVEIQSHGQTNDALSITDEVKKMGRAVMSGQPRNSFAVLNGSAIINIALKYEKDICTSTGDKAGLARIERESHEGDYLKAGVNAYVDQMITHLLTREKKFFALPCAVSSIVLQIVFVLGYLTAWSVSIFRSRNRQANELHLKATERAFPVWRLFADYFLIFVPAGIVASFIVNRAWSSFGHELEVTIPTLAVVSALPVVLQVYAHITYSRALRKQAEQECVEATRIIGRRAPWEEKREFNARMAGVHGGALIFLTICALGISAWMRCSVGYYPWQLDNALSGIAQEETQYLGDLLAHKIKVSDSAIRNVQQTRAKYAKRSGGESDK